MSRSSSLRSGVIPRSSVRDLNPPIITFVGRLDASQKGFDVFLDALELAERADTSSFSAWLVGGSSHEAELLLADIARRPVLAAMHSAGRLTLWGRVDIDCLPELYSRSSLVAMPSRRETFGLVAVQAMLCRTPIAASYVGGLRHTVIHRATGAHFVPGSAAALAFIITALVNNRPLADWLGGRAEEWALRAFGDGSPDSGFHRILTVQDGLPVGEHPIEDPHAFFRKVDEQEALAWLGQGVSLETIPSHNNSAFRAVAPSGEASFVKAFTERPDYDLSLYRLDPELAPIDWRARLHRSVAAAGSNITAPLLESSGRLARFAWAEPGQGSPQDILASARAFGTDMGRPPSAAVDACRRAFRCFAASPRWGELARFDRAAAQLNAPLTGKGDIFVRCDPRVEIARLRLHATAGCWPLEADALGSMLAILDEAGKLMIVDEPALLMSHGDLTVDHVRMIGGERVLCDLEEARYAFGDLDAAGLALDILRRGGTSIADVIQILTAGHGTQGSGSAALWLVTQAFHRALGRAAWGQPEAVTEAAQTCANVLRGIADLTPRRNVPDRRDRKDAPGGIAQ